jgi:hypothetical protein
MALKLTAREPTTEALPDPESVLALRMGPADMPGWEDFLVDRIGRRHPSVGRPAILGWLRGQLYSNECWFAHSDHAIAMAETVYRPFGLAPVAREVFVLGRDGHAEEAAGLYPHMARWAKLKGAETCEFEAFTDVPTNEIRLRFMAPCNLLDRRLYLRLATLA